jgi:hypothetical protein
VGGDGVVWWSVSFRGGPHDGMTGGLNLAPGEAPPARRSFHLAGQEYTGRREHVYAVYQAKTSIGRRRRRVTYVFVELERRKPGHGQGWSGRGLGRRPRRLSVRAAG